MLEARSIAEARLYIEHESCAKCGHRGFGHPAKMVSHGERLAAEARGYCPRCGVERTFDLLLAEERVPPGAFGAAVPSTLIDAGQWFEIAEQHATHVPAQIEGLTTATRQRARDELATAIAALTEVEKFIPPGTDEPPRTAFFTAEGRDLYVRDPRRFSRDRVELLLETWRELAATFIEN